MVCLYLCSGLSYVVCGDFVRFAGFGVVVLIRLEICCGHCAFRNCLIFVLRRG